MKIRSTSSRAMVFGWRWPIFAFFAGNVTSMTSCFIFSSRTASSSFCLDSSSSASILVLVSFTSCPTFGRSSGATSFMLFKIAVSSPFLPRYATRTSFSLSRPSDSSIRFLAASASSWSLSFISMFFFLLYHKIAEFCAVIIFHHMKNDENIFLK